MFKKIFSPKILGFILSNALAIVLMVVSRVSVRDNIGSSASVTLIFSEFVILPFAMGLICAWYWRKERLSRMSTVNRLLFNTFFAILLSLLVLKEGVICLIIVSPLLWCFMVAGAFTGKALFGYNNQNLNVSVVAILAIIFITDAASVHQYENKVADVMVIKAPPAKVWQYVVAYKRIEEKEKYWLFKMGMPSPVQSTADGYYLGAGRKCIFSDGYTFDEKIVTYDENRNLTFDITNQPRDPEIMGHIDILRGQFLLKDNGDGTTTLTGNSWYRLYVFPVWYYDLWAESVTRNVHIRVMEHIKKLSEAD